FLRSFADPKVSGSVNAKRGALIGHDDELRTALSKRDVAASINSILGKHGLRLPLKHKGFGHNYRYTVVLRGKLGNLRDGNPLQAEKLNQNLRVKEKEASKVGNTTTWSGGLGVQGRVYGSVSRFVPMFGIFGPRADHKDTKSMSTSTSTAIAVDRLEGDGLKADGSVDRSDMRWFAGDMNFELEVLASRKQNRGL